MRWKRHGWLPCLYRNSIVGDVYIVRSQIGHFADNKTALESMEIYDVLKGAKAKKMESGVMRTHGTAAPQLLANTTDSYYNVADLLALVKDPL